MVNTSVYEAYNRGITDIFHVGDITDGDYSRIRPIHNYEVFLYGATGQLEYTLNTLPKFPGMKWHIITGSHDQTHLFNYGVDIGKELEKEETILSFLGKTEAFIILTTARWSYFIQVVGQAEYFLQSHRTELIRYQVILNLKSV